MDYWYVLDLDDEGKWIVKRTDIDDYRRLFQTKLEALEFIYRHAVCVPARHAEVSDTE